MPPTFFIFLGIIAYFGLTAVTCIVFIPMLLFDRKRLFAQKVLATVLISFPCLIVTGLFFGTVLILPALLFAWLVNNGYISEIPTIILGVASFIIFAGLVGISALYLWYFVSKLIYQRLDKKPVRDVLLSDKVFKFLRPYLLKFKFVKWIYNYSIIQHGY